MMKKFIEFFEKEFSDQIKDMSAETEDIPNQIGEFSVELNEDAEITIPHLQQLIALCGDTFTFTISVTANCEDDNCGMMRYDSHYEGVLWIEIRKKI
tara:strand:+ start:2791 stop:3081 length:291 start_codon:yes stop_codon:yes gene_type:complete